MEHYNRKIIKSYIMDNLSDRDCKSFEEHILVCEKCMELYIELVDNDKNLIIDEVSKDFLNNTMEKINYLNKPNKKQNKKNIFFYYVAASLITVFLTYNGVFQNLASFYPDYDNSNNKSEYQSETEFINYGWTDRIINKTFNDFNSYKRKLINNKKEKGSEINEKEK
jgi:hypothetical protein